MELLFVPGPPLVLPEPAPVPVAPELPPLVLPEPVPVLVAPELPPVVLPEPVPVPVAPELPPLVAPVLVQLLAEAGVDPGGESALAGVPAPHAEFDPTDVVPPVEVPLLAPAVLFPEPDAPVLPPLALEEPEPAAVPVPELVVPVEVAFPPFGFDEPAVPAAPLPADALVFVLVLAGEITETGLS